tara:strand:+ start:486 stop:686 length:201 start_codon:yes stop_codon:yes gene_type:complete
MSQLVFVLSCLIIFGCSQNHKNIGKNIIKTTNLVKGIQNTTAEGIKEEVFVKTKDILDPNRGGGIL